MTVAKKIDPHARLIKAMAHPLRHRILIQLNEREASPSTLSRVLGEPLGNVAYHVKILLQNDAVELVDTRPVRGAIEHIYRASARPYFDDEHWASLPLSLRQGMFDNTLQKAWDHIVAAAENGGLDDPLTHVSWTTLDLDRQGYEEVVDVVNQTLERVLLVQAESAGRLAELPEAEQETERTELTILHYHRPRADSG
jgi:DNA-binding transcriptional ArsR family regulator